MSRRDAKQTSERRARLFLYPLLSTGGLVSLFFLLPVQALSIGERGPLWRVSPGDTFTLRYTHSMYGVEVREKFRIGPEDFTLYGVESSAAALEYLGIESPGPNNVQRTLKTFSIPAGSVGDHELRLNDFRVRAGDEERGRTTISLVRISLIRYLAEQLRRSSMESDRKRGEEKKQKIEERQTEKEDVSK
jgi:hypothetical protein